MNHFMSSVVSKFKWKYTNWFSLLKISYLKFVLREEGKKAMVDGIAIRFCLVDGIIVRV